MQRFIQDGLQTASNKTPRRINRNLVFNLIRTKQPISRADLARVCGLQRSTISLIVEDLLHGGWIVEGSIEHRPRGRRPTFLELNRRRAIIALDIHPAQTTIAVADVAGGIITRQTVAVPVAAGKAVNAIISAIRKVIAEHSDLSFEGIGICLPGRTDLQLKKLIFAPNLHWPVVNLKSRMERATGLRVEMDNVANACALAEVWFGANDGLRDLVVVNVAEGIGTGIFANGRLLRGQDGMAGEFGHVQVDANGPLCACGKHGCWETLASNTAALRYYQQLTGSASPVTFDHLLRQSQQGEAAAVQSLSFMAEHLGRGLRMVCASLAPGEIVIVGDITTAWHLYGAIVEREMKTHALTRSPVLRPAYDGSAARLRSAVSLVLSQSELLHEQGAESRLWPPSDLQP